MYLRILVTRLKNFGILNLYIMKTMKLKSAKLVKANKGKVVKGVSWIDKGLKSDSTSKPYGTGNPMADGFNDSIKSFGNIAKNIVNPTSKDKMPNMPKKMTGGMVNSNAKVSALAKAGSNGVKSGVNPKAKASAKATGKSGGTSKAPKDASPKKIKKG